MNRTTNIVIFTWVFVGFIAMGFWMEIVDLSETIGVTKLTKLSKKLKNQKEPSQKTTETPRGENFDGTALGSGKPKHSVFAQSRSISSDVVVNSDGNITQTESKTEVKKKQSGAMEGSCNPKILDAIVPLDKFQKVSNLSYVFSAFFDGRPESGAPSVRVIAVAAVNSDIFCHLWFKGQQVPIIVQAEVKIIKHFRPVIYENAVVNCPFNTTDRFSLRAPVRLVLSSLVCGPPDAILDVIDNSNLSPEVNFTVCLHKSFIRNYNRSEEFIEWVEMNRILGAERFLVYNFTGGSALTPYLQHYVKEGIVELHEWPVGSFKDTIPEYRAQGALINDCIYRTMYKTKYLMLMDVDEVMVPQWNDTWAEALRQDGPCKNSRSILVRNSFFLKNYKIHGKMDETDIEFLDLTHRVNFIYSCPIRTKIIMKPEYVRYAGVHFVIEQSNGSHGENCCFSPDHILLQHYRFWTQSIKHVWDEQVHKTFKYDVKLEKLVQNTRMKHFEKKFSRNVRQIRRIVSS